MLYVVTGALILTLGLAAWPRRAAPGGRIAILNATVIAICWCWALAAQTLADDLAGKLFWHKLRFVGAAIVPATFLLQVLECTGRRAWVTRGRVAALAAVPALATLAAWTSEWHELGFRHLRLERSAAGITLGFDLGPALWLQLAFVICCCLCVAAALAETALVGARPYRGQARALLFMLTLPWLSRLLPWPAAPLLLSPGIHPLAFLPAAALMWLAVFRLGLLDLVPLARGTLVAGLSDALVVLDRQDRVIEMNPAAARTLGTSAQAAVGRDAGEAFAAWPGWPPLAERLAGFANEAARLELSLDQGAQVLEATVTPIGPERDGQAAGRLILLHDVTERTQAQTELARARHAAEAANAAKGEFLARMGHEVRTPLNGVLGLAELLLSSPLEPEQRRRAEALRRSGRVLLTVLDDILDAARLEAGRLELALEDFDPRVVVQDVAELYAREASAKGLRLEARVGEGLPACVHGDPTRVHQALANLVANALKFTSAGRVTVTSSAVPLAGASVLARFEVADTGPGVPVEARERLFQAFAQADAFSARRFGGSGLGLAICRQLAELMGGTAGFTSGAGGSTFWFTARLERRATAADEPRTRFQGRVLVADDQPVNRMVLEGLLQRFGCEVDLACDGHEALERATGPEPYDLVLLDVQMPGLDGPSAAAEIRRREGERRTPIVALSAGALPDGDHGLDDQVAKPVSSQALQALLERFLARAPGGGTTDTAADALPALWQRYLREAVESVESLRRLLAAGDAEALQREAHRLKGSSLFLGATRVAELCERLPPAREDPGPCLAELEHELTRLGAESR